MAHSTIAGSFSDSQKQALRKNVAPSPLPGSGIAGLPTLPKEDPVLLYLAQSDEREYEKMRQTDIAISSAIEQRITGLVSKQSEIVEGPAGTAMSKRLRNFAITMMKNIPNFTILRQEVLLAIYYGWRPVSLEWTSDLEFEGRPFWGIKKAVAKKPWNYEFVVQQTPQGQELHLAEVGVAGNVIVYDKPLDKLRWMICTSGSTETPYGESFLRRLWMLHFISRTFEQMGAKAMQRALGVIKASQQGSVTGQLGAAAVDSKIESDLKTILDRLTANNILMETQGWQLDFVDAGNLPKNHNEMMGYFNNLKRIAIVGQNLTSEVKGGSFAATREHSTILESFFQTDAMVEASWYNDQMILPALEFNFGTLDPNEVPRWKSKIFSEPDLDATKAFFDMGGTVDGRRLATALQVPALFEVGPEDVPLSRFDPRNNGSLPNPLFKPTDKRIQALDSVEKRAEAANQAINTIGEQVESTVAGELRRYYDQLAAKNLEVNADPKA